MRLGVARRPHRLAIDPSLLRLGPGQSNTLDVTILPAGPYAKAAHDAYPYEVPAGQVGPGTWCGMAWCWGRGVV